MILLLDVDGVLNSSSYQVKWIQNHPNQRYDHLLDPEAIERLHKILDQYHPRIVLTSAWRHDPRAISILKDHGIPIWKVADDDDRVSYVVNLSCKYPTQTLILLDDDVAEIPKIQHIYLVKTHWKTGLQNKHIRKIRKIMRKNIF